MEEKPIRMDPRWAGGDEQQPGTAARITQKSSQLQIIFDNVPDAIILLDRQSQILNMNLAAKILLGEPQQLSRPEDWPERSGLFLDDGTTHYPGDRLPPVRALQGEAVRGEEMLLRNEASQPGTWISMSAAPLKGPDGGIEGAIVLVRDISYAKRLELSRQKHALRTESLYKLSRLIAEVGADLNRTANIAASFTSEVIGDLSVIMLLDGTGTKLQAAAYFDPDAGLLAKLRKELIGTPEFAPEGGLESGVLKSGEPLLIPSLETDNEGSALELPGYVKGMEIESILIVPMIGRSGVLGTINLFRHRGSRPYNADDQSFLMDISYRMALAIENCRLFDSLREEISERLSTKEALDISEERFKAIFESTSLGIKVLDLNGNILQTNSAFQNMLGYKDSELLGRHFSDFIHSEDVERAARLFKKLKDASDRYSRLQHRTVHKDNSVVWVKTEFSAVRKNSHENGPAFIFGIVEDITEQKRNELEVAELNSRLQNSMELERLHLAQELHDNPMQALYSAIYRIEELRGVAEPELKAALEKVNNDIKLVLQGLRTTAKELRPPTIFNFGLENAIRSYTDDFEEKHPDVTISLSLAHDRQLLPEKVRLALFRVFQQSLTNILRHAEATEIQVRFSFDAEEARLEISDNGKGFEVPSSWITLVRQGHYGLAGSAERVQTLGGSFHVESKPGNSTFVRAIVPLRGIPE